MVYQLQNQQDAGKVISQIQLADSQFNLSDFQWFISTIYKAINEKLVVNLLHDANSSNPIEYKGIIETAELDYDSNKTNISVLTININDEGTINTFTYTFNAELVEENKNSTPGSFMKYYINDNNHQVIARFVVNYK